MSSALLPSDWLTRDLAELADLSPIQEVPYKALNARGIRFLIRRDDLIHPYISGNKLYKLYGFLKHYQRIGSTLPIATFGGKYSNHILALAAAGQSLGLSTKAIIRGDEQTDLSATLIDAQKFGMDLHFVDRQHYKQRHHSNFYEVFEKEIGPCFWVPEGGAGAFGVEGAISLGESIAKQCNADALENQKLCIFQACGTGSSLAGIVAGVAKSGMPNKSGMPSVKIMGVNVLKGFSALKHEISQQIPIDYRHAIDWDVLGDFHCGGYAKFPDYLASFLTSFEAETKVALDPVYTCKVAWAITQLAVSEALYNVGTVLMVHSGGLQGRRGYGLPFQV